jgi:replication factor C subunit 2/4
MKKSLAELLRPGSIEELTLDKTIKAKLASMHENRNVMNMLFHGRPGSGKTSAARILCDKDRYDILPVDGSSDSGIETVRSEIYKFTINRSVFEDRPKICFIDEADYLSKNSQAALRKIIEDNDTRCRFILAVNDLNRIHPALQSRLYSINFDPTTSSVEEELPKYIERIKIRLQEQNRGIEACAIKRFVELYFPDYRRIANTIEFELLN